MSKVEPLSAPSSRYQKMKINMFKITKFLYNNVTSYQLTEKRVSISSWPDINMQGREVATGIPNQHSLIPSDNLGNT